MRLTPRKDEIKAVVEVLEDPSFKDGEAMAKALIKRVGDLFEAREWYALAWRDKEGPGSLGLAWGPFPSDKEVERFVSKLSIGGVGKAVKLYSATAMAARVEAVDG